MDIFHFAKMKNKFILNESTGKAFLHKNYFSYNLKNCSAKFSSGGPILIEINDKKYIIGFNTRQEKDDIQNGHRFTQNELIEINCEIKNLKENYGKI